MAEFKPFAAAIHAQFNEMSKHELFVTVQDKDALYAHYLASFPPGSNPIFRERTEHDCSCCRNFIKNLGAAVAIVNGEVKTVWDIIDMEAPYDTVAAAMSEYVKTFPIMGLFRSSEPGYGAETSRELLADISGKGNAGVRTWNHFHGQIAAKHRTADVGTVTGDYATTVGVFKRGLMELKAEAFTAVVDLIEAKALYRGEEHLTAVKAFQAIQTRFGALSNSGERNLFVWAEATSQYARFRNTAIGSLLVDLSGIPMTADRDATAPLDLEDAVKSFEQKVAPTNYKRPTALITPAMIAQAMKTIDEMGLQPALERRFAKLSDISVNNVLWVDNSVQGKMKDGIEGLLMSAVVQTTAVVGKAEDISIADFMANVVPGATSMDILVKNTQQPNFVSLTAPKHSDTAKLFKWNNDFAWSYDGNITDSIKERVKAAGGRTDAKLRASLAWFNFDDLDIHAIEPDGYEIYFANRSQASPRSKGRLDVDMNAGGGHSREPVENIVWDNPQDGEFKIVIHNYCQREVANGGFTLEIESNGALHQFSAATSPRTSARTLALILTMKSGNLVSVGTGEGITGGAFSQEKWGIATETFTKVSTLMHSPNHWDCQQIGNKHYIFCLEGCRNPDATRGIYNEFLSSDLEVHRKVFEVLGDKTKCQPTDDQLSGVGFSSTRGDTVTVNVTSAKQRKTYNIIF